MKKSHTIKERNDKRPPDHATSQTVTIQHSKSNQKMATKNCTEHKKLLQGGQTKPKTQTKNATINESLITKKTDDLVDNGDDDDDDDDKDVVIIKEFKKGCDSEKLATEYDVAACSSKNVILSSISSSSTTATKQLPETTPTPATTPITPESNEVEISLDPSAVIPTAVAEGISIQIEEVHSIDDIPAKERIIDEAGHIMSPRASTSRLIEPRPIFPNVPYSPYGSPNSNRRRPPLRESRRISLEQSGSFTQLNQYKLLDQIGQGSYGLVKLAYSEEDSIHYALKILSKRKLLKNVGLLKRGPKKSTSSPLDRVYREIAVLKKLDHPNVVKLIEVLDDPDEDSLYMVFELVKQGEVLEIPTETPLNEERAWRVFRDTLLGLEYLHYQRIIHGDLKPSNLLVDENDQIKIADLGLSNEFLGEDATLSNVSSTGTPAFRAPETLQMGQLTYCGRAADIWALGVTLYSLIYGKLPFFSLMIPQLYEKIKHDKITFPENPKVSNELKDCIEKMLLKEPTQRITIAELKKHNWVTKFGENPLPTEDENCRLVQISDEELTSVVRSIPKLNTLILIKTMLKKHSFGNPFSTRTAPGRAPQRERFLRSGRSNSAPGEYLSSSERQSSSDILPSLTEHEASGLNNEEV